MDLECHQEVIRYFKTYNSNTGKLIVLEGVDGLGKSTLLKNMHRVNPRLSCEYFDLHNYEQLLGTKYLRSFSDVCCIHLCEHFPLSEIQQKQFICMLQDKLTHSTVVLSTRNYSFIKKMLPSELWSNSLLMKLSLPSKGDIHKFAQFRAKKLDIQEPLEFLEDRPDLQKTFAQVNHLLINFKEFGKEAVILKRLLEHSSSKFDESQEEIAKLVGELCKKYAIPKMDLLSRSRKKEIVINKHQIYYELKCKYHFTYPQIAKFFNIDHTTVMYSVNKIRKFKQ